MIKSNIPNDKELEIKEKLAALDSGKQFMLDINLALDWSISQLLSNPDIDGGRRPTLHSEIPNIYSNVDFGKALLKYYTVEQTDFIGEVLDPIRDKTPSMSNLYPIELTRDIVEASIFLLEKSQMQSKLIQPSQLYRNHVVIETLLILTIQDAAKKLGWQQNYHVGGHNGPGVEGRIARDLPTRLPKARENAAHWRSVAGQQGIALAM